MYIFKHHPHSTPASSLAVFNFLFALAVASVATMVSGVGQPKEVASVVFLLRALLCMAGAVFLLQSQVWVETSPHGNRHL